MSRKVSVVVDGDQQDFDLDELLVIVNEKSEREEVSALIAYWGAKFGEAVADFRMAEAATVKWEATQIVGSLRADEKVSEWKAKAFMRAAPEFATMKDREARAEGNMEAIKSLFEGFKQKGRLLERLVGVEQALIASSGRIGSGSNESAEGDPRTTKAKALGFKNAGGKSKT